MPKTLTSETESEYDECPFCDRLFVRPRHFMAGDTPMEAHIREDHGKVKVWKGRNAKWVDASEIAKRLV